MKRLLVLAAVLAVFAMVLPASGVPGPEPEDEFPTFDITIHEPGEPGEPQYPGNELWHRFSFQDDPSWSNPQGFPLITTLDPEASWDFGDRRRYACAWVELVHRGEVVAIVYFERYGVPYTIIIDKFGDESDESFPPPPDDCRGTGSGEPPVFENEPHFLPPGVVFSIVRDGVLLAELPLPAVSPDNSETHFVVGNEPGEALLWYHEAPELDGVIGIRVMVVAVADGVVISQSVPPEGDCVRPPGPGPHECPPPEPSPDPSPEPTTPPPPVPEDCAFLEGETASGHLVSATVCI